MAIFKTFFGRSLQLGTKVAGKVSITMSIGILIGFFYGYYNQDDNTKKNLDVVASIFSLCCIYVLASSIILIIGAGKEYKNWILPWLIGAPPILIGLHIFVILYCFPSLPVSVGSVIPVFSFFYSSYFTLIVTSYYCELNKSGKEQKNNSEPSSPM